MMGKRMARLRRDRGINQAELARQLGISASAVGMYEQGRREPDYETLQRIARALDTSAEYLITGEEPVRRRLVRDLRTAARDQMGSLLWQSADGATRPFTEADLDSLIEIIEKSPR